MYLDPYLFPLHRVCVIATNTAAKLGVAELTRVIIRVAEQIVTKHLVEAALPRLVGIAPDVDAFDEFHLLLTCVLNIDIDV